MTRNKDITPNAKNENSLESTVVDLLRRYRAALDNQQPKRVHSMIMSEVERILIQEVMQWANNNQVEAAKILGIHRNTLRTKLEQYQFTKG